MCKFLVVEGYTGEFCEKLLEVSLCLTEPRPAGSMEDLLLVMAGPISSGGRDSGITQLGKGEKSCTTAARGVRVCQKHPCRHPSQYTRRKRSCSRCQNRFPCSP